MSFQLVSYTSERIYVKELLNIVINYIPLMSQTLKIRYVSQKSSKFFSDIEFIMLLAHCFITITNSKIRQLKQNSLLINRHLMTFLVEISAHGHRK